jgi:hypothetical protein
MRVAIQLMQKRRSFDVPPARTRRARRAVRNTRKFQRFHARD